MEYDKPVSQTEAVVKQASRISRIYFGWWISAVTGLLNGLAQAFQSQGMSVIFKPLSSEFGFSRAVTSVAAGTGSLCNGVTFVVTGWLADKFGPKYVVITGMCVMGFGLAMMYFINSAWTYYIVWGILVTGGFTLGATVANDKMMTDWFVKKRGLALGIRFALMGSMGVAMLPVISWLTQTQGWRMACLVWAGLIFATLPLLFHFVRQKRPEYYGLLPDGAKMEAGETSADAVIARGVQYAAGFQETEFSLREALRTRSFWILTVGWVLRGMIFQGFNVHCIPFLTDMGIDPIVAATLMAMMVFCTIPSRFFSGIIADRVKKEHLKFLLAACCTLEAIGIITFLSNQTMGTVYVFLILFGFGDGAYTPLDIVVRARYFGRKAYGSIQGLSVMISAPIIFFAPVYVGWVYDVTGSYLTAFTLFTGMAVFTAFLLTLLRAPKTTSYATDIGQFI